eukprot:g3392.t1
MPGGPAHLLYGFSVGILLSKATKGDFSPLCWEKLTIYEAFNLVVAGGLSHFMLETLFEDGGHTRLYKRIISTGNFDDPSKDDLPLSVICIVGSICLAVPILFVLSVRKSTRRSIENDLDKATMTDGVYDLSTLSYIITGCLGLTNIILGCCVLRMWAKKERWKMRFIAQTGILESRVAEHKHKETANTRMIAIKSRQSDVRFVQNTKEFKEKDFLSRWVLSTENIIIEDSEEKDDRNEMHGETLLGTNHRGTCIIEGHMCSVRVKRIDVAKLSKTSGHDEGGGERGKGKSPHLRSHAVKRHSSAIHVVVETIRNRHKNQCTLSGDGSRSPPRNSSSTHECVIDLAAVRDMIRCSSCVQLPYFIGCAYDASSASLYILLDPVPDGRPMSHIIWDPPVEQEPNWVQRMRWLMDISEGLEYLHQRGIVHGNLRSTNIVCYTSSRGGSRGGMDRRRDSSVDKKEANKFALTRAKLGDPHHFGKMLSVAEREKKAWHKIARDDHAFLWFAPELIRSVSTYRIYTKRRIRSVLFHRERSRSRVDSKSSPGTRAFRSGTSFASMASIFRANSDSNADVLSPPTLATKTSSPGPSSSPLQSEMQNPTFVPPERKLTEDMYAFGIIMSEAYTLQSPWDWVRRVDAKASKMRDAARRVDQETAMFSPGVPTPRGSAVGRMFKMTSVFLSKDAYSGQKEDKSQRKKRRDIVRHERHQIEKAVLQARRPDAFYLQPSSRATEAESDEKNELKRGLSSKVEEDKKDWNCFEYMFVKLMNKCCRQSPNHTVVRDENDFAIGDVDSLKQRLGLALNTVTVARTSEDVQDELFNVTDRVIYCAMSAKQVAMYDELKSQLAALVRDLEGRLSPSSMGIVSIDHIKPVLAKLRALENHPDLVSKRGCPWNMRTPFYMTKYLQRRPRTLTSSLQGEETVDGPCALSALGPFTYPRAIHRLALDDPMAWIILFHAARRWASLAASNLLRTRNGGRVDPSDLFGCRARKEAMLVSVLSSTTRDISNRAHDRIDLRSNIALASLPRSAIAIMRSATTIPVITLAPRAQFTGTSLVNDRAIALMEMRRCVKSDVNILPSSTSSLVTSNVSVRTYDRFVFESGKMIRLRKLLRSDERRLRRSILILCRSSETLDLIEDLVVREDYRSVRLDREDTARRVETHRSSKCCYLATEKFGRTTSSRRIDADDVVFFDANLDTRSEENIMRLCQHVGRRHDEAITTHRFVPVVLRGGDLETTVGYLFARAVQMRRHGDVADEYCVGDSDDDAAYDDDALARPSMRVRAWEILRGLGGCVRD